MSATAGTWYPPSLGTGGFLHEGQLFTNPPFKMTTPRRLIIISRTVQTNGLHTLDSTALPALPDPVVPKPPPFASAPLPLLGLGAAWAWARQLRRRIKAAQQPTTTKPR